MTLTIELKLNGELIGGAIVMNQSQLAALSVYDIESVEKGSRATGHPTDFREKFSIRGFHRKQSVWALVERVARMSLERRNAAPAIKVPTP